MNFDPYDIHDFNITMNNLIENREEGTLVGVHVYDTSKEYNLKIIEAYLENIQIFRYPLTVITIQLKNKNYILI